MRFINISTVYKDTAFVGIHTGHLGFYADWKPAEMEKLVISIARKEYDVIEYPLLEVTINYQKFERKCTLSRVE